jgi:hypothetical protein
MTLLNFIKKVLDCKNTTKKDPTDKERVESLDDNIESQFVTFDLKSATKSYKEKTKR